jgi:hypothetical protein
MDGCHGLERIFEVVIGVADQRNVDGVRGQLDGNRRAQHASHILDLLLPADFFDVLNKLGNDLHGVNLTGRPNGLDQEHGEYPGASANIGHSHAGFELAGRNYLVPVCERLPVVRLEFLDELLNVRILVRLVDPWPDTFFLGLCGSSGEHEGG